MITAKIYASFLEFDDCSQKVIQFSVQDEISRWMTKHSDGPLINKIISKNKIE